MGGEIIKTNEKESPTTPEIDKGYDGVVFTFVDQKIDETQRSLAIVDGREYYGKLVTDLMTEAGYLRAKNIMFKDAEYFNKCKDKRLLELIWEARLKINILMDTEGGNLFEGAKLLAGTLTRPDTETYITNTACSMGAVIMAKSSARHVLPHSISVWHNSELALSMPEGIDKFYQKSFELSKGFFLSSKTKDLHPLIMKRIFAAEKDPKNLRNEFMFLGIELFALGLAEHMYKNADEMQTSLCSATGIEHEEVTRFFEVSEETWQEFESMPKDKRKEVSYRNLRERIYRSRCSQK